MIPDIEDRLEPFWDDYLIDTETTTAELRVNRPVPREAVLAHGEAWEGDGCDYFNIVHDGGLYRMYYLAWEMLDREGKTHTTNCIKVCYAQSTDGLHWKKPALGLCEFGGTRDNNIILDEHTQEFDNFMVMADGNPSPAVRGKYKAVAQKRENGAPVLAAYVSDDGLRFEYSHIITRDGAFDSLNTVHWSAELNGYVCFVRGFHGSAGIRDIRVLFSKDFISWSAPELLNFGDARDIPLYTNCASPYPRAPHILTGFPTRYIERTEWTANFDRLCGAEKRRARAAISPRYGLALTDCVFMCSRDGLHWTRHDDSLFVPGPENGRNWVYGDAYPALGLIETPSGIPGAETEYSMYLNENHWMGEPTVLRRYTVRKDGFVSRRAGEKPKLLRTKPFRFRGDSLELNFSTSAFGCIRLSLTDTETGAVCRSGELFGDSTCRRIDFDARLSALSGRAVVLEAELCDADLFAMRYFRDV